MSASGFFDQRAYWLARHQQFVGDARSVGNMSLSHDQNLTGDRLLAEFLTELLNRLKPGSILDLGCGYGRACAALPPHEAGYLGLDVSPIAISQARKSFPNMRFELADLTRWKPSARFDLVLCVYSLSMFPDDAEWEVVFRAALDSLAEGGTLLILDFMREEREQTVAHVAYRGRKDYARITTDQGFAWDDGMRQELLKLHTGGHFAREASFIRSQRALAAPEASPPAVIDEKPPGPPAILRTKAREQPPAPSSAPIRSRAPVGLPSLPTIALAGATPAVLRRERGVPPRMLVVSWDMGHNPVGRGYLLADMARRDFEVEYAGPGFAQFGDGLWPPIRNLTDIPTSIFPGGEFPDFLRNALEMVGRHDPDVVYVSKPRLPSLLIGILFRLLKGSALLVDVDDHELSFFKEQTPLTLDEALAAASADPAGTKMPFSEVWTRLGETLVSHADAVTVSNAALQRRFGGIFVRHGRDEKKFRLDPIVRARVRDEFGLTADDVAIIFIGTPRPHKGIFRIAEALERIDDDRLVFVVIGTITDARIRAAFAKYKKARIRFFGNQPWERLHELIQMADQVAILQDPASPIAQYQIPAKLTDALSIGLPAIVTRVPPLEDIIAAGAVTVVDDDAGLDRVLRNAVRHEELDPAEIARVRRAFLSEFSFSVNAARIEMSDSIALEASRRPASPLLAETVLRIADHYGVEHPLLDRLRGPAAPAMIARDKPFDLVFFWKQNDSDIYGRRSDMMVKYLLQSGRISRILHFDRLLSLSDLERNIDPGADGALHQGNLVYLNTVRRVLRMADSPRVMRRSFLCRDGSRPQSALGRELPGRDQYPDFIRTTMRETGFNSSAVAWVCPVVFDFPQIQQEFGFSRVIADLIDDQRQWQAKPDYMQRVTRNYADILGEADLVVANCTPVQEGFRDLRDDIVVVPNGAEVFAPGRVWEIPEDMADLPRPIIGYVGNLRDRIDLPLIELLARRHPKWSILLVGSAHDAKDVIALAERTPNIHLLGVRPYEVALGYIHNFDVAIMPHLNNALSERMNPLKLYVYYALGVPIVTSDVANIADIGPLVTVAQTHVAFLAAVEAALGQAPQDRRGVDCKVLAQVSWPSRVEAILQYFDKIT